MAEPKGQLPPKQLDLDWEEKLGYPPSARQKAKLAQAEAWARKIQSLPPALSKSD